MSNTDKRTLTEAQVTALRRKFDQNNDVYPTFLSMLQAVEIYDAYAMVYWAGMYLGVETDGYTHS